MLKFVRLLGIIPGVIMLWVLNENPSLHNRGLVMLYIFGIELMEKMANYMVYRLRGGRVLETFKWKTLFKGGAPILLFFSGWYLAITINEGLGQIGAGSLVALILLMGIVDIGKGRICEEGIYVKGIYCDYSDISISEVQEDGLEISMKVAVLGGIRVRVIDSDYKIEKLKEKIEHK